MIDHFAADLELKQVSIERRLIVGTAAAHHNIDRVRDIIDPSASQKATRRLSGPADVAVFVGHNSGALPIGIPQRIEATPQGLYTETYVLKGPAGDNLLAVARDLADHGQALGMSIGYKTHASRRENAGGKTVRRIMDYELKEYSFAAQQAIANPDALVSAVKARRRQAARSTSQEVKMQYRVEQQDGGERWSVLADTDADGDADDNLLIGTYPSADIANAVADALRKHGDDDDGEDDGDDGAQRRDAASKTARDATSTKATWSTSFVNDLEDACFLYVEDGGKKDDQNKTVPRTLRHFPYKSAPDAAPDLPHLRNAIARIPQSDLPDDVKARLQARARRLLAQASDSDRDSEGGGKTDADAEEWKGGAPLSIYGLGIRLIDLAEQLADEHKAMALLAEETKDGQRIRPAMRAALAAVGKDLADLLRWAETIERGEDGKQRLAWFKQQLALTEV